MDQAVFEYLSTLGQISTTFVGFATLIMMFRQGLGGPVSPFHSWVTLVFIQLGFVVTAGSLLPDVLQFCGLAGPLLWRVCSGAIAAILTIFLATYHARRRAVSHAPAPIYVTADVLLLAMFTFVLAAEALNKPLINPESSYAVGLTGALFTAALGYLHALGRLHRESKESER